MVGRALIGAALAAGLTLFALLGGTAAAKPGQVDTRYGFNALAGRESEQIRVGSCPQWFGYSAPRLFLDVTPGAGPITTRLVR